MQRLLQVTEELQRNQLLYLWVKLLPSLPCKGQFVHSSELVKTLRHFFIVINIPEAGRKFFITGIILTFTDMRILDIPDLLISSLICCLTFAAIA